MAGISGNPWQPGQIGFNPYLQQQPQQVQQQAPMAMPTPEQASSPVSMDLGATLNPQGPPSSGSPLGGLAAAAPTGTSSQTAAPNTAQTAPEPDPTDHVAFSGPNALRQGIGQRNPPNLSPVLTGLRNIY